ncbi:MAG: proprotein convertase P-domain-containing protein, partial [Acidobacteria bacterium]|nr:proprotein convertase P-domain-containing protein [Acidobacteriota bacterium]
MKLRTYLHRNLALLLFCGVCALTVMWSWQSWRANAAPQSNQAGPSSPDGIWQSAGSAQVQNVTGMARTFQLRADTLERTLSRAPREYSAPLSASPVILSLPMPDGRFQRFQIEESPSLDPGLAARFPDIKSYRGAGLDDRTATMRFDYSPIGFHALVLTANSSINIRPVSQQNLTVYMSIVTQSETGEAICSAAPNAKPAGASAPRQQVAIGPTRKNYRMAIATTGEYSLNYGGNPFNVANVVATLNTWLNLSNVIYERDLNAHFNLVNNTNIIFTDANTDGLTNTDEMVMINEIGAILDAQVGNANYDIGHVLGLSSGAGEGGAGVASLFAVCADGVKGRGATRLKGAIGNSTALGVVAHEFGHQFSANHTFNGTLGNCAGDNRSSETSWETGSGNTLMSYNNTCAADNVTGGKDLRFHGGSYGEVQAWLATTTGGSCGAPVATGNTAPTVASGGNFTIPRRTPFTLTAVGGDADAQDVSALTYTWDELDVGGDNFPQDGTIASFDDGADPNNSTRPIFRALRASTSPARTFPNLTYILNNANIPPDLTDNLKTAEQLPRVGRLLNFRVLVRDGRGGVNEANAQLTVAPNTGPFELTAPNGGEALTGGNNVNVTWNVAGTSGAPINAANVKLSLSTDSGLTFPVVLAANTPNDGTQAVAMPNGIVTTTARIKIEAVGNIFFDISDANFSLTPGDGCLAFSALSPAVGNVGSNVTVQGINFNGVTAVRFGGNVTVNCPSANCTINSNTQLTATVPAGATSGPLTLVKTGCTDVQTSTFLVCPNPPTTLALDDDAVDTRTNEGDPSYYVNRLTPAAYPATLSQISVFYPGPGSGFAAGTSVTPTTPITVVAGSSTTGSPNNTVFQTLNTTVGQLDTFVNYQLPNPITITTGDFIVGFIANTPGLRPIAIDDTSNANRSYYSSNGTLFTAANGNYMIRGQVFTGNCGGGGGGNCPTVTGLNPPNGQVGANVTITGTNFAGITGVKFSNNVNATINNNTGTQLTVTVPAGAVTGPITISKTGCADVQTATFTINAGCPTITITPTALNAGTVNTAYNQTLTADGGQAPYTFSLTAGNSIVNRFEGTGPLAIPDNTPAGADLPINVSGLTSSITKVTASVHLTHTYDQDLTLRLIGPDGTTINLAVKRGGDGDNYGTACAPDAQRTLFDDAAATAITAGAAPFVGSFKPEQALTAFNGKSGAAANGIWKLRVIDDTDQDTGSIQCASIFITQTLPAPGLSLSSTGVLSGTPTTAGPFTFTVKATDNNNCMKTQEYTLTINAAGGNCPTVTGINPTNGAVGSQVVITGTNFTGVTGVKFSNNVTATINNNTGTQLTVTVPAGAVTGPITISKTSCADVQTASFTVNTTSNGGLQFYPLAKPIRLLDTRGG